MDLRAALRITGYTVGFFLVFLSAASSGNSYKHKRNQPANDLLCRVNDSSRGKSGVAQDRSPISVGEGWERNIEPCYCTSQVNTHKQTENLLNMHISLLIAPSLK